MIAGKSVMHGSVRGFIEQYRKGMIELSVEKVEREDSKKESFLYNISQLCNGVKKDLYFPTPNATLRPFSYMNGAINQSWCCKTVEEEDPSKVLEDDLDVYALYNLMELIAEAVCDKEGLDPAVFLAKFTSENHQGEPFAWYDCPNNNIKSKTPWTFENYICSAGTPTFKLRSALIQKVQNTSRSEVKENRISIKFAIGRNKFNPNQPRAVMIPKRTIHDLEAKKQQTSADGTKPVKRIRMSKAAEEKVKDLPTSTELQEAIENASLPEGDFEGM